MYNILTLNAISKKIYDVLDGNYAVSTEENAPDGILVRSFNMADYEIKGNLLAVARAGAGVNNIPLPRMTEAGVVVFNTPGANANAVKELVLCGMLLASRDILGGNGWVGTLAGNGDAVPKMVEKGKSKFAGTEILGKTLGVVGLGAIGCKIAVAAKALGMDVIGYDPLISDARIAELATIGITVTTLDNLYKDSDYITLHVPLLDSTRGMISADSIAKMKDGAIILNMSRAELANVADVKAALADGKIRRYVVDFPTEDVLNVPGIIVTPHLGASTEEAEDNCAKMAAAELKDYLENGNIVNSVNFPNLKVERSAKHRIAVTYNTGCGVPEAIINEIGAKAKFYNKERGTLGYAIIDTDNDKLATIAGEGSLSEILNDEAKIISIKYFN